MELKGIIGVIMLFAPMVVLIVVSYRKHPQYTTKVLKELAIIGAILLWFIVSFYLLLANSLDKL